MVNESKPSLPELNRSQRARVADLSTDYCRAARMGDAARASAFNAQIVALYDAAGVSLPASVSR